MADDLRHYERYFEIGRWWLTPDEMDAIRKELGSAEDILERHRWLERHRKQIEQREATWLFLKRAAGVFVATMAALTVVKGILPAAWWPW